MLDIKNIAKIKVGSFIEAVKFIHDKAEEDVPENVVVYDYYIAREEMLNNNVCVLYNIEPGMSSLSDNESISVYNRINAWVFVLNNTAKVDSMYYDVISDTTMLFCDMIVGSGKFPFEYSFGIVSWTNRFMYEKNIDESEFSKYIKEVKKIVYTFMTKHGFSIDLNTLYE